MNSSFYAQPKTARITKNGFATHCFGRFFAELIHKILLLHSRSPVISVATFKTYPLLIIEEADAIFCVKAHFFLLVTVHAWVVVFVSQNLHDFRTQVLFIL